ncbi:MAG TPA: MFS transporter [Tepidisphaeraceae bacterium]|jgi:D-galactonate transporter|nr:MFS transporter [Tepidisphaeraceae bacterium]
MSSTTPVTSPDLTTLDYATRIDEDRIIATIIRRLMPFLCLLFIVNYLDRTNVAMAKLQMLADTGISNRTYGLASGMFFIGYFIFEVPSNLILQRVGARIWITRIMLTWGLISGAMMFVRGPQSFYGLRFLLGAAEAGFFPGIVLYLTYWIPSRRRASVLATFLTATAVSGIVGNPLAGVLMKMEGIANLHGWQWLFLLEGIIPVLLGIITWFILPDRPSQARWLTAAEKEILENELARETQHSQHHVAEMRDALADSRLWLLSVIYFMIIMGLYGFVYWVPSIIKSVTAVSDLQIGFLSAIPSIVGAVTMVLIAHHADRHNERRWHVATTAIIAACGVVLITRCHSTVPTMFALSLAAIGIFGSLGPFWALATRFLRASAAAAGIAIVNSVGALAGFVAPYAIGWLKDTTGGYSGLLIVAAALACGAVLVLCIPRAVDRAEISTF